MKARVQGEDRIMVGLDRPYINLSFHKKCYNKIEDMESFLFLDKVKKLWYK